MKPNHSAHLAEQALTDLLLGVRSAESEAHFRECAECRMEAVQIARGIASFQEASLTWAQGRVQAGLRVPVATRKAISFGWRTPAGAFAAVALAAGVYRLVDMHPGVQRKQAAGISSAAEENRRLLAIDKELSAEEPSPRVLYKRSTGKVEQE